MISVRWKKDGVERVKSIDESQLERYLSYGWIVDKIKQEPVSANPVPVVESPLQILEKAVDAVVDAPEAVHKRKAGRPSKHRR